MTRLLRALPLGLLALVMTTSPTRAQLADTKVITLEGAKAMVAAAEAEASRNQWAVAIAIVDAAGDLILFHKLDGTLPGSVDIAIGKARTSARLQRPTKALEDAIAQGRIAFAAVEGLTPLEGAVPVIVDGQYVGAVGVSGATSAQDAQVAEAGARALGG